jgi:hypothetical protein
MQLRPSTIETLLDEYVSRLDSGIDDRLVSRIIEAVSNEEMADTFHRIGAHVWDKYSVVNVDLMVGILRRWLALEPDSVTARHTLGHYLLLHGPDWDDEANALLNAGKE